MLPGAWNLGRGPLSCRPVPTSNMRCGEPKTEAKPGICSSVTCIASYVGATLGGFSLSPAPQRVVAHVLLTHRQGNWG